MGKGQEVHTSSLRVLLIGGEGRSGTTVLEQLAGGHPAIAALGEVEHFARGAVSRGERCECGEPLMGCGFWADVGREALGGWDGGTVHQMETLFQRVDRLRNIPRLMWPLGARPLELRARQIVRRLYAAARDETGAEVLLDSSKNPGWAALVAGIEDVDLRILHMVRHPAAVAHSWSQPKLRPQATGEDRMMPTFSPARVAARWSGFNAAFHVLEWKGLPTLRLRYEDFADRPEDHLRRVLSFAGLASRGTAGTRAPALGGHGVAGNPVRFGEGVPSVRRDDRWLAEMSLLARLTASGVSWPMRRAYGYGWGAPESCSDSAT